MQKVKNITIDHTKGDGQPATTQVFTQPLADGWLYSKSENGQYVVAELNRKTICDYCCFHFINCLYQLHEFKHSTQ
jgi:hypothetical protein